jgi:DNA-binding transcriptional regulator YbjK
MAITSSSTASTATARSAQREQTRSRMLEAVLEIAVEDGMRAVRHRAVAERAGVSLGSTTYHFSSIEELIFSAFDYWRSQRQLVENPFYVEVLDLLEPYGNAPVPAAKRREVAMVIYELSVAYLVDQITTRRQDRLVEMAFHHESMRYPSLRAMVIETWRAQQAFLETIHRQMLSPQPEQDAAITGMLFRQLEQNAIMSGSAGAETAVIRQTLRRHMSLCFQLELPDRPAGAR